MLFVLAHTLDGVCVVIAQGDYMRQKNAKLYRQFDQDTERL